VNVTVTVDDVIRLITVVGALIGAVAGVVAAVSAYRNGQAANDAKTKAALAAAAAQAAKEAAQATREAARIAAEEAKKELVATRDGVFEVGHRIDGRLDELLALTRSAGMAEGVIKGTADEKARVALDTAAHLDRDTPQGGQQRAAKARRKPTGPQGPATT
jgi:hypothetical protein